MTIDIDHPSSRTYGTFPLKGDDLHQAVKLALKAGYRAFDTAQMYGNEQDLGTVLNESALERDALFLVTKIHPDNYSEADFNSSLQISLDKLQTDYVDLLLVHWPPADATDSDIATLMQLLDDVVEAGHARHIGVSNFNCHMMRVAQQSSNNRIFCNQVEFHPLLDQFKLLECSRQLDIPLSAYCSNARGKVTEEKVLQDIGNAHGKSAVQVSLRWALQHGVALNTMSTKAANIHANFDILDFELSSTDMESIDDLSRGGDYRIVHKGIVPWAPDWD